ncbi:unnamed protein product, partial [marine sediment metagenome]
VPTRVGFQTPFTNNTFDLQPLSTLANEPVIIGGKLQNETYGEFQHEMNLFNRAFLEIMAQGALKYLEQLVDSFRFEKAYNYSRVTKDIYENKSNSGSNLLRTGLIVFVIGILTTVIIIIIAKRSEKAAKQTTAVHISVDETIGSGIRKSLAMESEPHRHVIKTISSQNVGSEFLVLGRPEQCANCERVIGKLEHSCIFKDHIVCVRCYQKLK